MNILIRNQKLSSINYKDFQTNEKMCYIYIVNGFEGNRSRINVEHTFKVGKTFSCNPISGRINDYRKIGDINVVRLFRFENISSDKMLLAIESKILTFCGNPSLFVCPNFVVDRRSEWFNGDVDIVVNFVEKEYEIPEENQDNIKILGLYEKIKNVLNVWDENECENFYVLLGEENFVEDIKIICQTYKIDINNADEKWMVILLIYLLNKLFQGSIDGQFTPVDRNFLYGDYELNKITRDNLELNGYDCMSNILNSMENAYNDIYNKIRNGVDFCSSNQVQERLFYFSSYEMFQHLVHYHIKNNEHGNKFRNMIVGIRDLDRPIDCFINFETTYVKLTHPEKLGFEDKADYVGYYIDKYFHKKLGIKRQTMCPNRLKANHMSSPDRNDFWSVSTQNYEDIYQIYLHKYNHTVCVKTYNDYFSSRIEPPFEEVSTLEYDERDDEQFCSKVFDHIKNMIENDVGYPSTVENENENVDDKSIPCVLEETDDIVADEEKVEEEQKDEDISLVDGNSEDEDGECIACNGSGISYWSDGVYGECIDCDSGQINSHGENISHFIDENSGKEDEHVKDTRRLLKKSELNTLRTKK